MSYEPVTIREAAQLEVLLFVGLAFVGSLLVIYWGFQTYQFARVIRDTAPEPVRSVSMGRTEVRGRVVPDERVYDQPFTEGRCVYGEYEVEEYRESSDDDDSKSWETIGSGTFGVPFYIDDGTGRILVEPNDDTIYEISDEHTNTIQVDGRESPPAPVREFLGSSRYGDGSAFLTATGSDSSGGLLASVTGGLLGGSDGGDDAPASADADVDAPTPDVERTDYVEGGPEAGDDESGDARRRELEHVRRSELGSVSGTSRKRRYTQRVLPIEDETYVYGGATRRDPDEVGPGDVVEVMRTDPSTDEFIISDKSEFELARRFRNRSVLYIASGLVSGAMVLALLAQVLLTGPIYGVEAALP